MAAESKVKVKFELLDEFNGEPMIGAEFGNPDTGERVELGPGDSIEVSEVAAIELDQYPYLKRAESKSSPKKSS